MKSLERLCDLYFELSNEDRVRILQVLRENPLNITNLAKELNVTTQEVSRHVSRLTEVGLTERNSEGLFELTPYGGLTLRQIKGVEFTSRHRDYFRDHSLVNLPSEFVCQIGKLSDSTYVDDVMVTVHRVEEVLKNAEDYILNVNLPYIASAFPLIKDAFKRGVKARFIHTEDLDIPVSMRDDRQRFVDNQLLREVKASGQYTERLSDDIDLVLYMSEKEVAIVTFPMTDGKFDFYGFASTDLGTLEWCRDVFEYYWERAKLFMR
ncbi:MAG: helix-turn-helix domain-containing protein [Candidatus Bathyarchaeota archaeon]|nr:MAG: helix-turn-helix domain-containing protein [Candidatus Bathyarchaeota archaeon]